MINNDGIDIRQYIRILLKYKWLITSIFIISISLAGFISYKTTPVYKAVITLSIEAETPNIVDFKDVLTLGQKSTDYIMTQSKIIKSRTVAERAYDNLNLWEKHKIKDSIKKELEERIKRNNFGLSNNEIEEQMKEGDFLRFMNTINVLSVRLTRLVEVSAENTNPKEAADAANAIAKAYQEENLQIKFDTTEDAGNWLLKQIKEQRKKLHKAEQALQEYMIKNEIVSVPSFDSSTNSSMNDETNMRLISKLKEQLAMAEAEKTTLSSRYKNKHPKMIRLKAQIRALDKKIKEEMGESYKFNQKTIEYSVLRREVEVNRRIYDSLLNRAKETNISIELKTNNIRVIDPARVPKSPIRPRTESNIFMAAILGLIGGGLLAFFLENLDDTIKTPDEIKHYTKLQLLGTVPFAKDESENGDTKIELISHEDPKSVIAESFKTIRTAVNFCLFQKPQKSVLITSPGPVEGKTTCSVNLAVSMAKMGQKVLLVDVDMRKPRIHSVFGFPNDNGISKVLIDESELNNAILKTGIENLFLLPCGPIPPNPSELLGSVQMKQITERLKYSYDIIVFDSSPVMAVTDPVLVSTMVEAVVLVAQYNKTRINHLISARDKLQESKCNIIGIIANGLSMKKGGYYYYPYYTHYYSYKEDKADNKVAV